jgi:hypothetical protein
MEVTAELEMPVPAAALVGPKAQTIAELAEEITRGGTERSLRLELDEAVFDAYGLSSGERKILRTAA